MTKQPIHVVGILTSTAPLFLTHRGRDLGRSIWHSTQALPIHTHMQVQCPRSLNPPPVIRRA